MAILAVTLNTLSPALTKAVEPFCTKYGFPHLATHFPLALASLVFWVSLQFASALITPSLYAPYKNLPRKTRVQWHVHLVALVHAVIITPLAAAQWYAVRQDGGLVGGKHPLAANRLYGYTVETGNVYAIALGYFAWDVVVSALFDGPAFIAHGVVAMVAFTFVYHPIFMYDGLGFLLWELSTPFLNIHWFMDKTGNTGSTAQLVNAFFLLSSYVLARLTFGVYNSYSWFKLVNFPATPHVPAIPLPIKLFYSIGNVTLNTLNFIWFRAMIAAVQKRFTSSPSDADKKRLASGKVTPEEKERASKADEDARIMAGVGQESREDLRRRVAAGQPVKA
ncbi:hypothetical protein BCV69DRAFT_123270 [Microstroma glucosiphilum]|uniref:TLC domain-containing protein n=1 Tax=Pseudomicrostroma glucosiphilum TaxID=1684307 RepID=A0A316U005_9BASI|nr:hypothetical protein BCV69DRAFT_123270 [Pseudomicrostroma glucosiphilum]PWN17833.1 hypothetical protein BCV69DRAFT_123270 [Pseudomicrostroma glucosiphilum]